jgi:hypothetical protein
MLTLIKFCKPWTSGGAIFEARETVLFSVVTAPLSSMLAALGELIEEGIPFRNDSNPPAIGLAMITASCLADWPIDPLGIELSAQGTICSGQNSVS